MKQPLKTCISCDVVEIAVNALGELTAILDIRWKQLGFEKPQRNTHVFVNLTREIKRYN